MDENVLAAMKRWPNVPDVYGWLSLGRNGRWRLHPGGTAADDMEDGHNGEAAGEVISSPAISAFINRNYACDAGGNWYFQNGPQRVFVCLDAAPYILRTTGAGPALITHTGLAVAGISAWVLDDAGRLYARTEHGAGLIHGRDLPALIDAMSAPEDSSPMRAIERHAPLTRCTRQAVAATLGFVRFPACGP
jgi:hypothetical protein